MKSIATFTINPAIDAGYEVDRVFHTHKMRTQSEHYDPGGGGINVARVIVRLGGMARAYHVSGGATGAALEGLLDLHQMVHTRIPVSGNTRISTSIYDRESGKEYRFVPAGSSLSEEECDACLAMVGDIMCDYLVVSGSLSPGVPDDFYARMLDITRRRGIAFVLDTSGSALKQTLAAGGVLLVKPSRGELQQLVGRTLASVEDVQAAAAEIVRLGQAKYVAVTMGHEGAVLAHAGGTAMLPAVPVEANSAVGAGDSFLGAMIFALANGWSVTEAFRYGVAAGAATVLTPGTDLCHRDDVERLFRLVPAIDEAQAVPAHSE